MGALADRIARLAPRERRLLGVAASIAALVVATQLALGTWGHFAALRARVAGRERELVAVQRLAARLDRGIAPADAAEPPLLTRLEQAATGTVGRDRIADMTPAMERLGAGVSEERVAFRVSGASLAEVVSLLHALEIGPPPLHVVRLELRKLPAAAGAFAASVEVARTRRMP